jgi:DNA-binding NtrC family response regulator
VRELQNAVERAVLLSKGDTIEASDLPFEHSSINAPAFTPSPITNEMLAPVNVNHLAGDFSWEQIGEMVVGKAPETASEMAETDIFEQLEDAIVRAALTKTGGNKQAAANILGIYRPRLYHMMKKHGL